MDKKSILLNPRDLTRHQMIERCLRGKLTNQQAVEALNLSVWKHKSPHRFNRRDLGYNVASS